MWKRITALRCVGMMLVITLASASAVCAAPTATAEADAAVSRLYWDSWAGLWNDSVPCDVWTLTVGHTKNTFDTRIHMNMVGSPFAQMLRDGIAIPDDNTFVSPFMIQAFVRAAEARPDLSPLRDGRIAAVLNRTFQSSAPTGNGRAAAFGFWPYEEVAEGHYSQRSVNMSPFINNGLTLVDLIMDFSKKNSLVYNLSEFAQQQLITFKFAFNIPQDADDTGMNVNTAYLLEQHAVELPEAFGLWQSKQYRSEPLLEKLMRYSYCPANLSDASRSIIDPRTYFWAQNFIKTLSHPDDCLISTWLETLQEEEAQWVNGESYSLMPFNVNNVEATVANNALNGLTTLLLQNDTAWFHGPAKRLYMTSMRFVVWALAHQDTVSRPDFENLYYPTTMDFVHFAARHLRFLNEYAATGKAWPVPELEEITSKLTAAFERGGMAFVNATRAPSDTCGFPNSTSRYEHCWNGFLGESDVDDHGLPAPKHLDRYFVTASVASAIVDAFSTTTPTTKKLAWRTTTPTYAIEYFNGAVRWLVDATQRNDTSYECAFFSGSIHASNTMPFGYPANVLSYMNVSGSAFTCNATDYDFFVNSLVGVRGVIPDDEYARLLRTGCGGWKVNTTFQGFNAPDSPWPYWSSPTLTRAIAMKVIAESTILAAPPVDPPRTPPPPAPRSP